MNITIHFDGSCWKNPGGLARYGYTLRSARLSEDRYGVVGENEYMSNNHAEFFAMAAALEHVLWGSGFGAKVGTVEVLGDSEVAIRLMTGRYRAQRQKLYYPQYIRAKIAQEDLERRGIVCKFAWIPREENQECDDLSKMPVLTVSTELLEEAEELL